MNYAEEFLLMHESEEDAELLNQMSLVERERQEKEGTKEEQGGEDADRTTHHVSAEKEASEEKKGKGQET